VNVLDLLRAARRHPVALAILLVATMAVSVAVYLTLPTNYEADASLQLLPPNTQIDPNGKVLPVNPIGVAGGQSAQIEASVLAQVASSKQYVVALTKKGVTSTPAVSVSEFGGGTILAVSTTNRNAAAAGKDLRTLVGSLITELKRSQQQLGAPANSLLSLKNLTGFGPPTPMTGSKVKLTAVTGVLGLIVTLLVIILIDSRASRRTAPSRIRSSDPKGLTPVSNNTERRPARGGPRGIPGGAVRRRRDPGDENLGRAESR
jgi:hypothetical protein